MVLGDDQIFTMLGLKKDHVTVSVGFPEQVNIGVSPILPVKLVGPMAVCAHDWYINTERNPRHKLLFSKNLFLWKWRPKYFLIHF